MRATRVDGVAAFDDLPDDSLLVDHKRVAVREAEDGNKDIIGARDGLAFVAEDGELDAQGFRKSLVFLAAVHADANHLRAGRFELGDISLIRLQLARSATGEGFDVEGEDDAFLAAEIAQPDRVAILVGQGEVGCCVADFQCGLRHGAKC